jgi:hypothetical protein
MLHAVWNYRPSKINRRTKSIKEKPLAQLPPMTALYASRMNPKPPRSREILDETHCRDCGFLDTL